MKLYNTLLIHLVKKLKYLSKRKSLFLKQYNHCVLNSNRRTLYKTERNILAKQAEH